MPARLHLLLIIACAMLSAGGCRNRHQEAPAPVKQYDRQLLPGEASLKEVDTAALPEVVTSPVTRQQLKAGIANSLKYLATATADKAYPISGISKQEVVASLQELSRLLDAAPTDGEFNRQLKARFRAMMSVGCDGQGTVLFTGYYTPIFDASLTPDATYRYPLYRRPTDLAQGYGDNPSQQRTADGGMRAYPGRAELETSGALRGLELVYLADAFEAYVVQVQGSGKLRLPTGEMFEVGYDGSNNLRYHPIAEDLIAQGKIRKEELSLATLRTYFRAHPEEVAPCSRKNPRFIFFKRVSGGPYGSLGQRVTSNVSVATDKSIFPPGAAVLVQTTMSTGVGDNAYAGLRLDQDTGGAIRAPGRCDLYMGEGELAERRAGHQMAEGKLFYLLLK